jgi:hypothetical protein
MKVMRRWPAALLICTACFSGPSPPKDRNASPEMMPLPPPLLEKCGAMPDVRSACPTELPVLTQRRHRAQAFRSEGSSIFYAEWGAPYPGLSRRNAPTDFSHINAIASPVDRPFAFKWPAGPRNELDDLANAQGRRRVPLLVGTYTWGGKKGEVALSPPFPAGGIEGDHLVFRWVEGDIARSLSLHAWKPLIETLNALEAMVESTSM